MGEVAQQPMRCVGAQLDIGLGTKVLLTLDGSRGKHSSELVGLSLKEFLIFKMPSVPGVESRLVSGEMLTVRYMSEGTLTGFRTCVLSKVYKPGALIFTDFPESLEQFDLRAHKRIQCFVPARLYGAQGEHSVLLVDLSAGGCRLRVDVGTTDPLRDVSAGDRVVLKVNLFDGDGDTSFACYCRNVEISGASLTLGLSFVNVSEGVATRLNEYLRAVSALE